jgi:hypothetical protein
MNPMYVELLEAVLNDEGDPSAPVPSRSSGPLAELIRLRHVLEKHAGRTDPGWALQAAADQLAYDAALVRLARRRGVPFELDSFAVPEQGRGALERALVERGVNLQIRDGTGPEVSEGTG